MKFTIFLIGGIAALVASASRAEAGLIGSTVDVSFYAPNTGALIFDAGNKVVGAGIEYPAPQTGYSAVLQVDVTTNSIVITNTSGAALAFGSASFNGLVLTAPGMTFSSPSASGGFAPVGIVIAGAGGNQLQINLQGVTAPGNSSSTINFTTDPIVAAVPEPTSIALFGLTAIGGAFYGWRRRKLTASI